jgi:hypothetical protein
MIASKFNSKDERRTMRMMRPAIPVMILAWFLVAAAGLSFAQPIDTDNPDLALEEATHGLLGLNLKHQLASSSERPQIHSELLALAQKRQQDLAALMESNPKAVLRLAMPAKHRAKLPPAVQAHVEQEVTGEGTLEVLHEDYKDRTSRFRYFLKTGGARMSLHFADRPPTHPTGALVRVTGVQVNNALALNSGKTSVQVLAAAPISSWTIGVQKTAVILVNFRNHPTNQSITLTGARDMVFTQVSNFDMENSYGQTSLTGDVFGWYTIPMDDTVCDYLGIASLAQSAAAAAGHNLSGYSRLVYAFPDNACTWWGLGYVGGSGAWINGSFALQVVVHEMGHNFGLWHSHALECGNVTVATSGCSNFEYGDVADTMGGGWGNHFNAYQKELLGWLNAGNSPPLTYVQGSGTYMIDPYETVGTNSKALKIQNGSHSEKYYVEFRRGTGYDSNLSSNSNVMNGVVIHSGDPSDSNSSYLLDMTPLTSSWSDPALDVGNTFTDPYTGVSISLLSMTNAAATVNVTTGPTACVRADPTVTISPSQSQWVAAGTSVPYTVTVTSKDGTGCTSASFSLAATLPGSGWTSSFNPLSLSLSPGASATTMLQVISPATATDAFYNIPVRATNGADTTHAGTVLATYVVHSGSTGGTFSDNFDRLDSTSLGIGWKEVSGDLMISTKRLGNAGSGNNMAIVAALGGVTQSAEADFTSVTNDTGGRFGVVLRYQDPKNYYVLYRWVGGSSVLRISRVVNGVEKVLAQKTLPNPQKNTAFHLKGRADGTTLTLQLGTLNFSIPDATFETGGTGVLLGTKQYNPIYNQSYNNTVVADNFSATAN